MSAGKLTRSVVFKGVVYPAGTYASDITNADKIGADVWDGEAPTSGDATGYEALKVDELKAEIEKRNEGRDPEGGSYLSTEGKKADLVATLDADDAATGS